MAVPPTSFYEEWLLCSARKKHQSTNHIHISANSSIVFPPTIVKSAQNAVCILPYPCVARFTIFQIFKQVPSFTPVSPHTPQFPLSPSYSSCLTVPAAWLVQWWWSQRTLSSVYQSCAHFHWEPLCALGSVPYKTTDGEQDRGNKRRQGIRSVHMSRGQIQQVRLPNLPS